MKKTRLIVGIFVLVSSMTVAVAGNTGVINSFNEQKVTKAFGTDLQPVELMTALKESVFNTNTDALLPDAFKTGEKNNTVVIEKNDSIKTTKKKSKKTKKTKKSKKKKKSVGTFKITGYCSCSRCCGKSNGITASGTRAKAGRTIAADTSRFAFGSKLVINGHTYTVEDRGGAINGNKIDIYFDSHWEALQWGVRYCEVYVKK